MKKAYLFMIGLFLSCQVFGITKYTVTDLGKIHINDLNDSGQMTGRFIPGSPSGSYAFLYSDGVLTRIGQPNGEGYGINNSGQVTGLNEDGFGESYTFLYSNGKMTSLVPSSYGYDINNSGQVSGFLCQSGHAFFYDNTTTIDIGTLGGHASHGWAINDAGQIAGNSQTTIGDWDWHAFLYTDGTMTDLGTLGGDESFAEDINNNGQVVGYSYIGADSILHAFLYRNGQMTDLGNLPGGTSSLAFGINDLGQITGRSNTAIEDRRAFLYDNGVMIDLNTLIAPDSGWLLMNGAAINNMGQIAGYGRNPQGEENHAFLLTPIPEPATVVLLGLGGLAVLRKRN